jgi:regulator of protease activity HflC (stomatin/prohibitin superfamily)
MLQEGIYHVAPISEHVVIVSIMEQTETYGVKPAISAQSKDGQEEFLQITVNFQLQADQIQRTYRTIGSAWKDIVLKSPIQEAIRIVATHYEALEAAGKRLEMGQEAQKILQERLDAKNAGVNITIVTVDNVGFSPAFNATLDNLAKLNMDKKAEEIKVATVKAQGEQKITAATAEAESVRLKAKGEADAKISAATAEATANTLLGKSLTANVIAWQQMKIQEVMANKWQGNVPQTMLSGNGVLPIFNVNP